MATSYQMWLTCNGEKEKIQLPVLPEEIAINRGTKNQNINIAGFGEITIIQSRPAVAFSFSSFFPTTLFPGCSNLSYGTPKTAVDKIINWKDSKKPVHFIVTGADIDMFCTIETFNTNETGGDVGTIYYSLALKEYREVNVRQVKVDIKTQVATMDPSPSRVDNTFPPKTYRVKRGDCLWNIAQKYLGSGSRYTQIKSLNNLSSNLIFPDQILKIPS